MTHEEITEKVCDLVSKHLELPLAFVGPDTDLGVDLLADSLDMVELVMLMEDSFEIDIMETDVTIYHTVGDLVKAVEDAMSRAVGTGGQET